MTGTTHLTVVPDLKRSPISKPVTLEIRDIRVSTVVAGTVDYMYFQYYYR
jgi:hypothetical protein